MVLGWGHGGPKFIWDFERRFGREYQMVLGDSENDVCEPDGSSVGVEIYIDPKI